MPNSLDSFDPFAPQAKSLDDFDPFAQPAAPTQATPATPAIARPSSTIRRVVGDTAVDLGKGILGVGEAAVGLGNIVSGGYVGKGLEAIGYDPVTSKKMLEEGYTPERVAANKEVADAKGFMPTIAAAIKNPSTIAGAVVESAPLMLGGAGLARGGATLLGKAGSIARPGIMGQLAAIPQTVAGRIGLAAAGEGLVGAGSAAESIRQQSDDGLLDAKGTVASLASGAGTAILGALGGKAAQKLGIADVDVALAGGSTLAGPKKNILRRAAQGVLAEGVFEELPQSAQEQMWQNYATGKPIMDGVAEAAAMGALAGGVMGGGFSAIAGNPKEQPAPAGQPDPTTQVNPAAADPFDGDTINGELDAAEANAPAGAWKSASPEARQAFMRQAGFTNREGELSSMGADLAGQRFENLPPATRKRFTESLAPKPAEDMGAELDSVMEKPTAVQQAALSLRTEAQVMDAQAQTGIGKVAAMATAMQADAIEQEAPLDRLARVSAAAGIDPAEAVKAHQAYDPEDPEGASFAELPDEVLSAYARTLLEDAARERPAPEQRDVDSVGLRGNDVPAARDGEASLGSLPVEVDGGTASLAGQAPIQGDAAGAQAQGLTTEKWTPRGGRETRVNISDSVVEGSSGAISFEVRRDAEDRTPLQLWVTRDGKLTERAKAFTAEGEQVHLWNDGTPEQKSQVVDLLRERGNHQIGSPERKAIDGKIADVVTGKGSSRNNPLPESETDRAPVGSWVRGPSIPGVADADTVRQVADVPIDQIDATEFDSAGNIAPEKRADASRYAEAMRNGDQFPNARGSVLPNGKIKLQDGHRRLAAAIENGATTLRVAVNPMPEPAAPKPAQAVTPDQIELPSDTKRSKDFPYGRAERHASLYIMLAKPNGSSRGVRDTGWEADPLREQLQAELDSGKFGGMKNGNGHNDADMTAFGNRYEELLRERYAEQVNAEAATQPALSAPEPATAGQAPQQSGEAVAPSIGPPQASDQMPAGAPTSPTSQATGQGTALSTPATAQTPSTQESVPALQTTTSEVSVPSPQGTPVEGGGQLSAADVPRAIASMSRSQRDSFQVDKAEASRSTPGTWKIVAEAATPNDLNPERAADQLAKFDDAVKELDGQFAGKSRGASSEKLVSAWTQQGQLRTAIAQSRAADPEMWAAYDARQAQVAALKVGDRVNTAFGGGGVITRKFGKNWRILDDDGIQSLQNPVGLTPVPKPETKPAPKKPRSQMTSKELKAQEAGKAQSAPATGVDDAAVRAAYNAAMTAKTGQDYDWGKGDFGDMIVGALNRDPEVMERARNILTNGNNETGLKVFFKQAGVKFPKTQREQKAAFDAYIGVSPETRAASDAEEAKAQADKRAQKVASRRARQPVPDFTDYAEAVRWLNNRSEAFPSKGAYKATPEFAEWYEKAKPLYAPYKEGFTNKRAAALAEAGIKAGDRVQTSQIGMFMTGGTWTGTVTMRGGDPWVKVDGDGIPASKNGKVKQAKLLRWDARWKKAEVAATSPAETKRRAPTEEAKAEGIVATQGPADARGERKFYVTIIRDSKVARLAGPFDTKAEADGMVDRASNLARELDPRAAFDGFGVSAVTSENHKPGKLNEQLGLSAPPVEAAQQEEATHADPGEAPEAVTPGIVRESLQKAADKTPLDLKSARAKLLAQVDGAIAKATVEAAPPESIGPIDREKKLKAIGYVTFDVPGDGSFKVLNTKNTLAAFRRSVDKSPGFTGKKDAPPRRDNGPMPTMKAATEAEAKSAFADKSDAELAELEQYQKANLMAEMRKTTTGGGASDSAFQYSQISGFGRAIETIQREMVRRGLRERTDLDAVNAEPEASEADEPTPSAPPVEAAQQDVMESVEEDEPFFSAALRAVQEGKGAPKRGNAEAWKGWLDGAVRRGDMKQSERDWLGLDAWLNKQPKPVTREQLADFIRANEVTVQEVTLGGEKGLTTDSEKRDAITAAFERRHGSSPEASEIEAINEFLAGEMYLRTAQEVLGVDRKILADIRDGLSPPKFANYQLPGGENYRELLLTLPVEDSQAERDAAEVRSIRAEGGRAYRAENSPSFKSSHYDQPNILAHVRYNERVDADGKRVLFIEEIQSDWHQAGRKRGYGGNKERQAAAKSRFDAAREALVAEIKAVEADAVADDAISLLRRHYNGRTLILGMTDAMDARMRPLVDEYVRAEIAQDEAVRSERGAIPDAPFKSTDEWAMLAFKRMVRHAAENGFDRIAWTTGEQQAERYDLSKQVDSILYARNQDGTYRMSVMVRNEGKQLGERLTESELEEQVGKDIAAKIVAGDGKRTEVAGKYDPVSMTSRKDYMQELSGVDLKVGGEGMKGFYDKILPSAVNKWAKRLGGKVGQAKIDASTPQVSTAAWKREPRLTTVHAIDLTPAMRDAALQGQPLFSIESETLADTDATPAELASLKRQSQYGFRGSDGVGMTDNERSALQVLEREESRANGIEDADKLGLRKAVNSVIGSVFGLPPIQAYYLRGKAGLDGIATPAYIKKLEDQQKGRDGKMRTAGLYLRGEDAVGGKPVFVLFTDVSRIPWMAAFTAAHEVAGHHGLHVLLGKRLRAVLREAVKNQTVSKIADSMYVSRKFGEKVAKGEMTAENARYLAIEEALADLAAANATGNWQRIQDKHGVTPSKEMQSKLRAFIANVVRQIKMLFKTRNVGFSDAQVQQLLGNAFKAAQGQSASMSVMGANGALEQVVFHGTHARGIKKFSLQKIGTGEGAQAYGWGLYYASLREIADYYRKTLSNRGSIDTAENIARQMFPGQNHGNIGGLIAQAATLDLDARMQQNRNASIRGLDTKQLQEAIDQFKRETSGELYRVDIPEDSDLLDWDKLLSEQPKSVREAMPNVLDSIINNEPDFKTASRLTRELTMEELAEESGEALYRRLSGLLGGPEAASAALNDAGIPGLRYADGNSRNKDGNWTHNYVIWDESAIGQPQSALESTEGGSLEGMSRADAIAEAKRLGLPATGATDKIANLVRVATSDPATWSREDFDAILPHLSIHQDVRDGSADRVATVMARGLDKGMVDPAEGLEPGSKGWSWAKAYSGSDVYAFISGGLKFSSKDNPRLAPGNKPLFHAKPNKGGSLFDAISPQPLESTEDQTQSEAFKKWFGSSVVTEDGKAGGKPLVVYHGTAGEFDEFDPKAPASHIPLPGFFFTPEQEIANEFADGAAHRRKLSGAEPRTIPAFLSIKNPVRLNYSDRTSGRMTSEQTVRGDLNKAKQSGHDGAIITGWADGSGDVQYVAFRPSQIKSATGNNGNFDPSNPSILESVEGDDLTSTLGNAMGSIRDVKLPAGYMLADLFGKQDGKRVSWWSRTIGTQFNLAKREPLFKRVFDSVQNMVADISHYANAAMDLAPDVLPKFDTFRDAIKKQAMPAKDAKVVSSAVFDGTLKWARDRNGDVVQATELNSGIVWTAEELRSRFGATDAQIEGYRQVRAAIDRSLDDTATTQMIRHAGEDGNPVREQMLAAANAQAAADILSKHLTAQVKLMEGDGRSKGLLETAEQVQQIAKQIDKLKSKGYAPLSRFGRFTVYKDGENPVFLMFETQREANRAARMMREKGDKGIKQGTMSQEQFKLFKGMTPETLELFGEMLGLDKTGSEQDDLVYQSFLKAAKSNRSALKRLIHRQGIEGYSEDVSRVLAAFLYSNARLAATNLHAPETQRAINEIPKEQGDLKDTAIKLNEYIVNPDDAGAFLSSFNFAQYLGGSIASAMVNMTQPLTMSFPWLSQYGGAWNAAKALGEAVKLVGKGGDTGNLLLDEALKRADADGHTQPQEVHQLQALASGKGALRTGDGTKAGDALARAQNAKARLSVLWGVPFSLAEQFNRRSTFIAAWNIAKDQGMADPYGFAVDAVKTTQGIYNKANRPAWSRNAIGGMAFTFKTYSINYVEMLHRMWTQGGKEGKQGVMLAMGVLFLLSGAGGLPGSDDLDDLLDGVMQRFGYNFSTKMEREAFFASLFGESGAKFMEHGLSAVPGMPIDVSGRMGMGNLIPSTGLLVRKDDHTRDVAELAGPTGDFLKRSFESAGQLAEGNLGASMLAIAPRAVANAWKGVEMAETGEYRDTRGRKVLETTGLEAASKFIGFQPASVAKVQQSSGKAIELLSNYRLVSAGIADRWAKGIYDQDPGEVLLAQKELTDWNAKNPDMPIRINRNALRSRVRNLSMDRRERLAKTTPRAVRSQIETMLGNQDRTNTEETE